MNIWRPWSPTNKLKKNTPQTDRKPAKDTVLVISDLHAPFQHKHALDFLSDTYKKFKCTKVVCIGDEVDFHIISRHRPEPDAMGAMDEIRAAIKFLKELYCLFPRVQVCNSNHTSRPFKMAKEVGIPSYFIRKTSEFLEAPKGWTWQDELIIDNVLYFHGEGFSGQSGAINAACIKRMNTVIGHLHSFGGAMYHSNGYNTIFGLNVGCLIDVEAYAFRYGKPLKNKPTIGVGIVIEGEQADFIPLTQE